ncbi:MAG: hypothetical protein CMB82_03095 [Flammeovirgaceae bacterium]|nr:hypothetical protein [Flammeovirgaceae bacterium]|tara:strand:- start:1024 stop:1320 length:297 start_codon:yes stop_codon:yes gene_type:complete
MKKIISTVSILFIMTFTMSSCWGIKHTVGEGARGSNEVVQRQWYVLFGLVPLNDVNTNSMANGAENYTIEYKQTFVDWIIGGFTGTISIFPRTVKVTK